MARLAAPRDVNWLRAHVPWLQRSEHEIARDPARARSYAIKAKDRTAGPWEIGEPPQQGSRSDLKEVCDLIVDDGASLSSIAASHPRQYVLHTKGLLALRTQHLYLIQPPWRVVEVTVIWGPTGLGKTRWVRAQHNPNEMYILSPPYHANARPWFDGYDGEKVLLIDDMRDWLPLPLLLRLLDGYPISLEVKGAFVPALYTHVYITSNDQPKLWFPALTDNDIAPLMRRITREIYVWKKMFDDIIVPTQPPSDANTSRANCFIPLPRPQWYQ